MFDFIGMIKAVAEVANDVMQRVWGGRTAEQDRLQRELVDALEQKKQALALGHLDLVNHWDARASELRREIAAKYPG